MDGITGTHFRDSEIYGEQIASHTSGYARVVTNSTLPLSSRQREIVSLASEGLLNKQIAYALGITVATVKAHMSLAIERLEAKNRTHAVAIWVRSTYEN
jgi:DNA-binding NarL/FixJ family response regulator